MAQAALNPFAARSAGSLAVPLPDKDKEKAPGYAELPRSWLPVFRKRRPGAPPEPEDDDEPAPRTLYAGLAPPTQPQKYPTNAIRTSKYSLLLFVPKNLSEQFRRVANVFFLTLAVIQFFPVFQTIDPVVSALPLIIIVVLTMIKDALEDFRRHVSDNEVNGTLVYSLANAPNPNLRPESKSLFSRTKRLWRSFTAILSKPVEVAAKGAATIIRGTVRVGTLALDKVTGGELGRMSGRGGGGARAPRPSMQAEKYVPPPPEDPSDPHFAQKTWAQVAVGDFLLLRGGDSVPADMLLLSSSEPENVAYLETKNLDGETNLKIRYSVPSTQELRTAADCAKARFWVESEEANPNMYQFNGTLVTESGRDERLPVSPSKRSLKRKTESGSWISVGARSFEGGRLETVAEAESPTSAVRTPTEASSHLEMKASGSSSFANGIVGVTAYVDEATQAAERRPHEGPSSGVVPVQIENSLLTRMIVASGSASSLDVEPGTAMPPLSAAPVASAPPAPPSLAPKPSMPTLPSSTFSRSTLLSTDPVLHLKILPVNSTNLLLRGSVLRDTEWAIGFVVFTGAETKVVMNSGKTPSKRSAIEKMMNYHVLVNLFVLACICIVVALANPVWENQHLRGVERNTAHYLASASGSTFLDGLIAFLNALIQYQNIVPISLYLTVEIVKTVQAYFIYSDVEMYYEPSDRPCVPRAWNLSDDLGQIEYVFSDKTGTLTRNMMEFKRCTIAGKLYAGLGEGGPNQPPRKSMSQAQANLNMRRSSMIADPRRSAGSIPRASFSGGAVGLGMSGTWEPATPQIAGGPERGRMSAQFGSSPVGGAAAVPTPPRRPSPARSSISIRGAFGLLPTSSAQHASRASLGTGEPHTASPSLVGRRSPSPMAPEPIHYDPPDMFKLRYRDPDPGFVDPQIYEDLEAPGSSAPQSVNIVEFFTLLAVCHSVLVSIPGHEGGGAEPPGAAVPMTKPGNNTGLDAVPEDKPLPALPSMPPNLHYRAQSPDEAALVLAAKNVGITFVAREQNGIILDVFGEEKMYEVLNVLEFNSDRKRMSVIVRRPDDSIVVYTKGADAVMYERLAADQKITMERTSEHLDYFAEQGLRTLVLAYRQLTEEDYQDWAARYHEASLALVGREAKVEACAAEIERDLTLLGSTAIEDKLQEGVPEAIATMLQAGIHVCVLTGDKMETAINIGFSCNLLDRGMHVITVKGFKEESELPMTPLTAGEISPTVRQIREALDVYVRPYHRPDHKKGEVETAPRLALVIDGLALKTALEEANQVELLELMSHCAAVICCRVSPLQKAQVVELVKNRKRVMCLAIGDGANDVSMIQAADIGVGIAGEEGLQAVSASDYAIAQFRFLTRLLLVHGHWNYRRTSEMVFTFFYKNLIITIPLFLYQFYCGFSNSYIIDFNFLLFYQTFFTALSVFGIGIFDRDLDSQYLEDVPPLHIYGIKQHWFNARRFWVFMVEGVIQSVIVYFFVIGAYGEEVTSAQGWISDQFTMGTTMAITAITNANLFVGANSSSWTWPQIFCVFFGIAAVFVYLPLYSQSLSAYAWGEVQQVFGSAVFWTTFALTTCMMQGPRLTYLYLFRNYKPTDINIVEEIQKLGLEDELEWAIDTSRPPDDSEEHYAPKPPPSHGSMAAMPPLGAPPLGRFVSSAVSPALPGSPEMVQLDLSRKPLPPLLVPASEATDSPESIHRPTTTISPYNTTFMVTAGSVASTGSMTETEAMRVARGGSTSIRDMLTDTIVPHRGYSFSQGRGASIIILGAKIKEKFRRTMSRGDRNSASSSRGSLSGFFSAGNKSANATPVDAQQRLNDPNLTKSLPMIDLPSPTSGGSGDRSMHRSESSPQSRGTPMSAPTTMRVPRIGETGISVVTAGSPTRHRTPPTSGSSLPSSAVSATGAPMISLDTIPSASEAATGERSTLALASLADVFRSDGSLAVELSPLPDDEEARDSGPARG